MFQKCSRPSSIVQKLKIKKTSSILIATATIGCVDGRFLHSFSSQHHHLQNANGGAVNNHPLRYQSAFMNGIGPKSKHNKNPFAITASPFNFAAVASVKTIHSATELKSSSSSSSSSSIPPIEFGMRQDAHEIISSSIQAVDPKVAIHTHLNVQENEHELVVQNTSGTTSKTYQESDYDNIVIVSFGKASAAMTEATCEVLSKAFPNLEMEGITIIKDDHATPEQIQELKEKYNIQTYAASHPVPDARSVEAATEVIEMIGQKTSDKKKAERTLVVTLISGGGSALFCSPRPPLTLDDLMKTNSVLLGSGMNIQQMNTIRKRLERGSKGGQLATLAYPCTILTCVLSDVIGDPLDLIASGPTIPDDYNEHVSVVTWQDVWKLIHDYDLQESLPPKVLDLLEKGNNGELEDTPKKSHPTFQKCETVLVGNNESAVMAAANKAKQLGYNPVVLGTCIEGEAQHVANVYVAMAQHLQQQKQNSNSHSHKFSLSSLPAALIAGGETTVTLPPQSTGKGGRNQEIGLVAALTMQKKNLKNIVLASVGTDGTDGPTDAAGAIVDGGTIERVELTSSISGMEALKRHDAYTFFDAEQSQLQGEHADSDDDDDVSSLSLVKTGPTGTNVADVCVVLVK